MNGTDLMPNEGKPFEAGTKGFWMDYPNINNLLKELSLKENDIFTPCTNSSFYSPAGLEATAPVFSSSAFPKLPSPLGQVFATQKLFERLPLADRASMAGLLYATIDFTRNEKVFAAYDKMTAHELFVRFGLSKRLVDDFIRPTLLVGLFKPPEELSAAVTMELLYYYALAHQTSFDVRWIKGDHDNCNPQLFFLKYIRLRDNFRLTHHNTLQCNRPRPIYCGDNNCSNGQISQRNLR